MIECEIANLKLNKKEKVKKKKEKEEKNIWKHGIEKWKERRH